MTLPYGIDISYYQGNPDYALLNSQVDFVGIRASISWGYTDPKFRNNWLNITRPKLAYHVVYPGENAERQMRHFLSIEPLKTTDRLALDLELSHGYDKSKITDTVLQCLNYLRENTGRYPVIYSRASWVNQFLDVSRLPKLDWWLAGYRKRLPEPLYTPEATPPPALPKGVDNWLIHQTCERGNGREVGVGSYYVDQNRWNGTRAELDAYFGRAETGQPEPEPDPEPLFQARVYSWATPHVNVRAQPSTTADKVGIKRPLDIVDVYEVLPEWYKIQGGYIMSLFLERLDKQEPPSLMAVPLYSQRDPRWASDLMGLSDFTIEEKGCGVSIMASGLTYLGYSVTPEEYNFYASTKGGYQIVKEGKVTFANMYWKFPNVLTNNTIVRAEYSWIYFNQGWQPKVDAILADKRPVWTEVRLNGRQHWVLIIGKANGTYWILDPWHGDIVEMSSRYDRVYRIVSYRRKQ